MKLAWVARKYWYNIEWEIAHSHKLAITQWDVVKQKLKEKYLPNYDRGQLIEHV